MALYKILSGYIELEKEDDALEEIKIKLVKIAEKEAPAKNVEEIKTPEDIQNIGKRKGDPNNFLKEK